MKALKAEEVIKQLSPPPAEEKFLREIGVKWEGQKRDNTISLYTFLHGIRAIIEEIDYKQSPAKVAAGLEQAFELIKELFQDEEQE